MSPWENAAEVRGCGFDCDSAFNFYWSSAETLNVAAEEEKEKQPVSTLAGIQETRH
jgi:hypothetical protein